MVVLESLVLKKSSKQQIFKIFFMQEAVQKEFEKREMETIKYFSAQVKLKV